jgi:hypothetical protein
VVEPQDMLSAVEELMLELRDMLLVAVELQDILFSVVEMLLELQDMLLVAVAHQ